MAEQKNIEIGGSVMDGVAEKGANLESPTKKVPVEYTVYPIRWVVLFIFVFYSASNSMQWIQYSIIQDAVVNYYGVSSITVYWTSMIYMITYIPLIFPASWLLDKTGLRVTTIIGAFGTCFGAWLKVFSVAPDRFWLGFLGQTVVAISQVFILNIPPRLAAVWFGADQVSSACSVGVFGNQTVVAISQVFILNIPPRLAAVWFGADQVSSACSVGVFGNQCAGTLVTLLPKVKPDRFWLDFLG
ncbi:major facilitator superfamily domain-containing protein [Phthorimaea operculella]|nr:major facilitator superfamily domain-containing protein [Phthorimaea operculella]